MTVTSRRSAKPAEPGAAVTPGAAGAATVVAASPLASWLKHASPVNCIADTSTMPPVILEIMLFSAPGISDMQPSY